MIESCSKVPELAIPTELPTTDKIHRMATGFWMAYEEDVKAQWELNLQIVELRLKEQLTTPLEIWE